MMAGGCAKRPVRLLVRTRADVIEKEPLVSGASQCHLDCRKVAFEHEPAMKFREHGVLKMHVGALAAGGRAIVWVQSAVDRSGTASAGAGAPLLPGFFVARTVCSVSKTSSKRR